MVESSPLVADGFCWILGFWILWEGGGVMSGEEQNKKMKDLLVVNKGRLGTCGRLVDLRECTGLSLTPE